MQKISSLKGRGHKYEAVKNNMGRGVGGGVCFTQSLVG